jgi:hypothetical protein
VFPIILLLGVAACQTLEDNVTTSPLTNSWDHAQRARLDAVQSMFASELGAGRSGRNVAPRYQEARMQSAGSPSFGGAGGGTSFGMSGGGQQFGGSPGGFGATGGFAQPQNGQLGAGMGPSAGRTAQQSALLSAADTAGSALAGGDGQADNGFRWQVHIEPYGDGTDRREGTIAAHQVLAEVLWRDGVEERSLALTTLRLGPKEPLR